MLAHEEQLGAVRELNKLLPGLVQASREPKLTQQIQCSLQLPPNDKSENIQSGREGTYSTSQRGTKGRAGSHPNCSGDDLAVCGWCKNSGHLERGCKQPPSAPIAQSAEPTRAAVATSATRGTSIQMTKSHARVFEFRPVDAGVVLAEGFMRFEAGWGKPKLELLSGTGQDVAHLTLVGQDTCRLLTSACFSCWLQNALVIIPQ